MGKYKDEMDKIFVDEVMESRLLARLSRETTTRKRRPRHKWSKPLVTVAAGCAVFAALFLLTPLGQSSEGLRLSLSSTLNSRLNPILGPSPNQNPAPQQGMPPSLNGGSESNPDSSLNPTSEPAPDPNADLGTDAETSPNPDPSTEQNPPSDSERMSEGQENQPADFESDPDTDPNAGLNSNPLLEEALSLAPLVVDDLAALKAALDFELSVPVPPEDFSICSFAHFGSAIGEIIYSASDECLITFRSSNLSGDISGETTVYDDLQVKTLDNKSVTLYLLEGVVYLATWEEDGLTFSLHFSAGVTEEDCTALISSVK